MRDDKDIAFELRRKGMTFNEISNEMRISKSTLSLWFKGQNWSKEITGEHCLKNGQLQVQRMNSAKRVSAEARDKEAVEDARSKFKSHMHETFFISGLSLYWGEGDKRTPYQVRITNTDPGIIRIFLQFLTRYSGIPRERVWISLIIYNDLNRRDCEEFWQKETGLSAEHFQKTVTIQGRGTERRSPNGICVLGVSSVVLKIKMLEWIRLLPLGLMEMK